MGKLDGSCLCGSVTYTCDADPIASANCHCRDCQKASGAPFTTNVIVPEDSVQISRLRFPHFGRISPGLPPGRPGLRRGGPDPAHPCWSYRPGGCRTT
jgi:hypothetical protein